MPGGTDAPSPRAASDAAMTERVLEVFREARGLYGSPRVTRRTRPAGDSGRPPRVARLMRLAQIQGRSARLYRRSRVGQKKFYRGHPNAIHGVTTNRPNQLWVADVTYVRVAGRWRYLAVVMDRHSRKVLGWSLGRNRDVSLTRRALAHAVRWRRPSPGVTFHSDRGIEYAAFDLGEALSRAGLPPEHESTTADERQRPHGVVLSLAENGMALRDDVPDGSRTSGPLSSTTSASTISNGSIRRSVTFLRPCSKLSLLSTRVSTKPEQDPSLRSPLSLISLSRVWGRNGNCRGAEAQETRVTASPRQIPAQLLTTKSSARQTC